MKAPAKRAGGSWVFVPDGTPAPASVPPWKLPANRDYYSLAKSAIVCALFYRTDEARMHFCVENNLMPPMEFRRKNQLNPWIDEQRARLARPASRHGKGQP
jgi:hypothetical protein